MKQVDFSNGNIGQNVIATALPMMAAQVLTLLYNIVDRIYLGRIPGEGVQALAGVGICFSAIVLILAFAHLFGTGGGPLCAIARGRGDLPLAEKIMNTAFVLLIGSSVVIAILLEILGRPLLTLLGASDEMMLYALPYLRIYLLGTPAIMLSTGLNPYITAQGFSGTAMTTVFVGTLTNIILDPVFIFAFGMGVRGAAIATVISQILSAAYVLIFLTGKKAELKLRLRTFLKGTFRNRDIPAHEKHSAFRLEGRIVKNIMGLGVVTFIMQFTNSVVAMACNSMLSAFGGDIYVTVYTIVSSVRQIFETPTLSVADGASPVLSYNYGAMEYERVRKAIRLITAWMIGVTLVAWLAVFLFPRVFISIFTSDPVVIETAVPSLHLYFFAFVFQAFQASGQTTFRALNRKKQAIIFSLLRKAVIVIPLTFLLPHIGGLGVKGVFAAEPISNVIGGTACFITMMLTLYRSLGNAAKEGRALEE